MEGALAPVEVTTANATVRLPVGVSIAAFTRLMFVVLVLWQVAQEYVVPQVPYVVPRLALLCILRPDVAATTTLVMTLPLPVRLLWLVASLAFTVVVLLLPFAAAAWAETVSVVEYVKPGARAPVVVDPRVEGRTKLA